MRGRGSLEVMEVKETTLVPDCSVNAFWGREKAVVSGVCQIDASHVVLFFTILHVHVLPQVKQCSIVDHILKIFVQ